MPGKRFAFAGNRFFVLEAMLAAGLDVTHIWAVPGSYLEKELLARAIPHAPLRDSDAFHAALRAAAFDIFIANGCPCIIRFGPWAEKKRFINIHPSMLPALRGADPVPGALRFGQDSGATAHLMDEGIDTGPIIAQLRIPYTPDLDADMLYRLSFEAERAVFRLALQREFYPLHSQGNSDRATYYTRKPEDLRLDFSAPAEAMVRQIRAFSNRSQGAFFVMNGQAVRVFDAEIADNPYLLEIARPYPENAVVMDYPHCLVIHKPPVCLKLKQIEGDASALAPGYVLG